MDVLKDRYTITELSDYLNITDHALRYYEKEFGLNIPKDERGRRYYTFDLANLMYQIKKMRDEGLEIKAIKNILQSENIIGEPPPVLADENTVSLAEVTPNSNSKDIVKFFNEFKEQIALCVSTEISSAKDEITKEIGKSKLELGACMENSMRKIESKMEKHFQDVDEALGNWREKNRRGLLKRLFGGLNK